MAAVIGCQTENLINKRKSMKKFYDEKTGVRSWVMTEWWQKALYWVGIVAFYYLAFCFVVGFIIGMVGLFMGEY